MTTPLSLVVDRMGMVRVTVGFDFVGAFLDLCEDTIVRVEQDNHLGICRFVLHVPGMASCEAYVLRLEAEGATAHWLVPVMPEAVNKA